MQSVKKCIISLMAIGFCSLFLLGCSSDDKETTTQEAPAETVIEQAEQAITMPADQQKAEQSGEDVQVQTPSEQAMATGEEQNEAVADMTDEATETDTEKEQRPRPKRALEGC